MSKKDEALKLALKLALEHAKRDERHLNHAETRYWCRMYRDIAEKAIEALAEQHEMTNIERHERNVKKFLAEQPAQQEQGDSNCQDADGCPTEMAVLQRFWRGEPIPAEHYPVWFKPAQQQEPVVWMYVNKSTHETKFQKHMRDFVDHWLWAEVPLYGEPLANHELQCVCGAVWLGDEMVHLPDKRSPASKPEDIRNATLDEIATKIEAMPFGDTAASFAVWIREQKT